MPLLPHSFGKAGHKTGSNSGDGKMNSHMAMVFNLPQAKKVINKVMNRAEVRNQAHRYLGSV